MMVKAFRVIPVLVILRGGIVANSKVVLARLEGLAKQMIDVLQDTEELHPLSGPFAMLWVQAWCLQQTVGALRANHCVNTLMEEHARGEKNGSSVFPDDRYSYLAETTA